MNDEQREKLGLVLRTINDTLRHGGLPDGCYSALEEAASDLRQIIKQVGTVAEAGQAREDILTAMGYRQLPPTKQQAEQLRIARQQLRLQEGDGELATVLRHQSLSEMIFKPDQGYIMDSLKANDEEPYTIEVKDVVALMDAFKHEAIYENSPLYGNRHMAAIFEDAMRRKREAEQKDAEQTQPTLKPKKRRPTLKKLTGTK